MVYIHEPIFGHRMYSRIIADSEDELKEFGELLGLQKEWVIETPRIHFEVYSTKLQLALNREKVQYLSLVEFEKLFEELND
jgi:hypothetical protein